MVFFSSRISPRTSTVILRDRSPFATAVVTSAMLRTCAVRFDAIALTESVRSAQVPATPGTTAWPPSLPSVPTSRATRVTSAAKPLSWSTIVLMVFLSSRISPRTSTVILRERSPFATAVVTSAMLRTCDVRFDAIEFTWSVRSFHVPATSGTSAWPPSLPSVPTSRATRVTSAAKPLSWSTIVLMVSFSARISPRTSTVILRDRSPFATAVVTSAMLRTCEVRFDAIALTESVRSFHVPATPGTIAWPPSLPSVPTSRATRVTSDAKPRSWSTIVLMASFSCRISPRTSTVILRDRSPFATAIVTSEMLRTCAVRFDAIWLTESVSSFQTPETPFTFAWPPSLPSVPTSRATRVTSEENSVICSSMRLTSVAERRNSPCSGRPSASSGTERVRSPFATPAIASVIVSTGRIRSSIRPLTERSMSAHAPCRLADGRRWRVRPLRPTCSPARLRPSASRRFWSTISLKLSASLPAMPSQWLGSTHVEIAGADRAHRSEQRLHRLDIGARFGGSVRAQRLRGSHRKSSLDGHIRRCAKSYHKLATTCVLFSERADAEAAGATGERIENAGIVATTNRTWTGSSSR